MFAPSSGDLPKKYVEPKFLGTSYILKFVII